MSDDPRKDLRDTLDELDRYFEELEKDIQEAVRKGISGTRGSFSPFMAGFSFKLGPEGRPAIQFFGNNPAQTGGYASPLSEQVLVEKGDIDISVAEDNAMVKAEREERKYRAELKLKAEVEPESGRAEYKNGVLEILFSLRDKTNKG